MESLSKFGNKPKLNLNAKIPKIIDYFGRPADRGTIRVINYLNVVKMLKFLTSIFFGKIYQTPILVILWGLSLITLSQRTYCQSAEESSASFFTASDTFSPVRFYGMLGTGTAIYAGASYTLYNEWYRQYELTGFHFFNDWGEWEFMDKTGHFYNAWFQGYLVEGMLAWAGLNRRNRILGGVIAGSIFQSTIEVMDGFSAKWGFSMPDIAANLLGTGAFAFQQYYWDEQRFLFKYSAFPVKYDTELNIIGEGGITSLEERAKQLYGSSIPALMLKDYNAQTHWVSFSPETILGELGIPDWLHIAVGYSAGNVFGGFDNAWVQDGIQYELTDPSLRRYHQIIIAPDINWDKVPARSSLIRSIFRVVNILKVPSPALEFNDLDGLRVVWHWIYY